MGGAALGQALIPIPMLRMLVGNIVGAALTRLAIDQANSAVLGMAAETGWTLFGLVDQDYTVPQEILVASGWKVIDTSRFHPRSLHLKRLKPRLFQSRRIEMTVLRRRAVGFGSVGYLN